MRQDGGKYGDRLRSPLLVSLLCHGVLVTASAAWGIWNPSIHLGSEDSAGGGGIVAVSSVPVVAARANRHNPVANPTTHDVPAPSGFQRSTELAQPEAPEEEAATPVPKAPRREAEKQQERSVGQRSAGEARANELRSSRGAALNSELYRPTPGSEMGFGTDGGPFGKRFGWYAQVLQRAIGDQWRRALGQVRGGASGPVVASFVIHRSGAIDGIVIRQVSGNRTLDFSAVRAIRNASPVPPLPPAMGRSSVTIEMHFTLK